MPGLFDTLKGSCGKEVVVGAQRIATQRVALHADAMADLPPPLPPGHYSCSAPFIMSGALPLPVLSSSKARRWFICCMRSTLGRAAHSRRSYSIRLVSRCRHGCEPVHDRQEQLKIREQGS